MAAWADSVSVLQWSLRALFVYAIVSLGKAVYNIYLHPLSKFPGPRLAAATPWWRLCVEVFGKRGLAPNLPGLHEKYGLCNHLPTRSANLLTLIRRDYPYRA